MSFLKIEKDKVVWSEDALIQPEVLRLKKIADKIDKDFFQDVATYIYFCYKKDGLYANALPSAKKQLVCSRNMPNRKWEDFETIPEVNTMIRLYIELSYTVIEKMYLKMKEDIDDLLKHISEIPWTKKIKVIIDVPMEGGDINKVEKWVEFNNHEEKSKAMKQANDIITYDESLRSKIIKETKNGSAERRVFDRSGE